MVRGHAKAEAQKKNAARHAADAKSAKNTGAEVAHRLLSSC